MEKSGKKNGIFVKGTYFDYPSLALIVFIFLFGLVMIYSASAFWGLYLDDAQSSTVFVKKQFLFGCVGLVVMYIVSRMRYQWIRKWTYVILILTFLLLIAVFFMGSDSHGSQRWLNLGFISFQPSEIAKLTLILYSAHIFTDKSGYLKSFAGTFVTALIPLIMVAIIAYENLSTGLVCAVIVVAVWFVATPKPWYLIIVLVVGVLFIVIYVKLAAYRQVRFQVWADPWNQEVWDEGNQTRHSLYAIATSGLFGRGLGQGVQKLGALPEPHNDMIFAVIAEELGIVGVIAVVVVFLILLWRLRFIAEGAPDRYGALIMSGIIAHIGFQLVMNMAVVSNTLPNTGVTLPFISYGGTSLSFLMLEMGIALSISRQIVPKGTRQEVDVSE